MCSGDFIVYYTINKELFLFPIVMLFFVVIVFDMYGFAGAYEYREILRLFEWMLAGALMWVVV